MGEMSSNAISTVDIEICVIQRFAFPQDQQDTLRTLCVSKLCAITKLPRIAITIRIRGRRAFEDKGHTEPKQGFRLHRDSIGEEVLR